MIPVNQRWRPCYREGQFSPPQVQAHGDAMEATAYVTPARSRLIVCMHYKTASLHEVAAKERRCRPQPGPRDPAWLERVEVEPRIIRRDLGGDGNGRTPATASSQGKLCSSSALGRTHLSPEPLTSGQGRLRCGSHPAAGTQRQTPPTPQTLKRNSTTFRSRITSEGTRARLQLGKLAVRRDPGE